MKRAFEIGDFVWMREAPDLCGVVEEIRMGHVEPIVFRPVGGSVRGDFLVEINRGGGRQITLTARRDELEWSLLVQLAYESR